MGILEISEKLRSGEVSPVELTELCLHAIEQHDSELNAFITTTAECATRQALHAESEIRQGRWRGPLHGVPLGLKDLFDTAGVRTTAGSALFRDRIPTEDAPVVQRLKHSGAILLGKQNLHEFAYGGSSVVSYYGDVHNPWNLAHIAGGSSGGSAAAVAAGLCYGAIGTDTAGSVREPASQCGVVGLKPTYARISIRGVIPLSVSLDHVGPLTQTVADAAILLQALAGFDQHDPYSADMPTSNYAAALKSPVGNIRIGVPRPHFFADLHPEVASATAEAIAVLRALTAEIRDISVPVNTDRSLQVAESYAYHAELVIRSPDLYQPETLRRIRAGEKIDPGERERLQQELAILRRDIAQVFSDVDVLVTPTVPVPAPTIAELKAASDQLRQRELVLLRNTRPFNVWGLPAISVPCGFTSSGLPIGLQIAAAHWKESTVLALAHAYEQATAWHKRRPAKYTALP
jgi:aspartyl-tRNA(Asn)/glutamyl-tRNA(Gln) amidotransferase subunit A